MSNVCNRQKEQAFSTKQSSTLSVLHCFVQQKLARCLVPTSIAYNSVFCSREFTCTAFGRLHAVYSVR